jgi:hydrogenase nickel incorporation protein HypA/HybF
MHELALMESVAELALTAARQRGAEAITAIHLRIGSLAGVEPEALRFAARVVLRGGLAEGARFTIAVVPARAWCAPCGALFALESGLGLCPRCGAASRELRQGRELELSSLELRLPDAATALAAASADDPAYAPAEPP